jgi:hypothetical protein
MGDASCPGLLGFGNGSLDTRHPLSNLQSLRDDWTSFERLFLELAALLGDPRSKEVLTVAFAKMWPDLESSLSACQLHGRDNAQKSQPDLKDIIAEIRDSLRELKASSTEPRFREFGLPITVEPPRIRRARRPSPAIPYVVKEGSHPPVTDDGEKP